MQTHFRVEFHCHTSHSKDCLVQVADLLSRCERQGIDRLVVTDHNTIAGAQAARKLAPERVIVGEEIMTREGELLAAFVTEEVPPGLDPREAIARLRAQGAFIGVSHPFDRFRKGHWEAAVLEAILPLLDAIEVFNARCLWPGDNRRAAEFAARHGVLGTAGSDAHTLGEVGRATMVLPAFEDAESLKAALSEARFEAALSGPWVHFGSRYAAWRKKLGR